MYLYRAVDGQGNTVEFCLSVNDREKVKCSGRAPTRKS